jgi:hypothetical protein
VQRQRRGGRGGDVGSGGRRSGAVTGGRSGSGDWCCGGVQRGGSSTMRQIDGRAAPPLRGRRRGHRLGSEKCRLGKKEEGLGYLYPHPLVPVGGSN